jgi:hypothetical protein
MPDIVYNIIGTIGVIVLLITYFLLQTERLAAHSLSYSLLNFTGSAMILISLLFDFNLPSFFVEVAWSFVSLMGILRWFRKYRRVHAA